MHTSKIPVIGLALAGITGCLLPWTQITRFEDSMSINGLCFAEGIFSLAIFFLVGLVSFFKTETRAMLTSYYKTVAMLSSIILAVLLFMVVNVEAQFAGSSSFRVVSITQYQAATGLFISVSAAAATLLYMVVQLILRFRKVIVPENWQSPLPAGRFYLPAHHNTTL